jgi:hypothetical protein
VKITMEALIEVIQGLQEKFPNELPKKATTIDNIHIAIGQQQVIAYLESIAERR